MSNGLKKKRLMLDGSMPINEVLDILSEGPHEIGQDFPEFSEEELKESDRKNKQLLAEAEEYLAKKHI